MGRITRRPQFVDDLRAQWQFIAKDSERHADAFVLDLEKRYRMLSDNPELGVARFPNYPQMRMFPFRRYLIIYTPMPDNDGVELIRLLHAARDYHRYFDD